MDNGHWQYVAEIDFEEWFGFIYRIVEISTGREYIGNKQFKSYTKKKVAGRKNKKSVVKQSDWKTYTGSSTHLNGAILENGMDNYAFFIESLHTSRGSLFYAEVHTHITENVLRVRLADGVTPKYFNRQVGGVRFIPPLESLAESHANIKNYTADRNATPDAQGKLTYQQYYGVDQTAALTQQLMEDQSNKTPTEPVAMHSAEQIAKWKTDPRRVHSGEANGMFGKACHENMTEEEKQSWKDNVSKSLTGIKRSPETREKMRVAALNRKKKKT